MGVKQEAECVKMLVYAGGNTSIWSRILVLDNFHEYVTLGNN